MRMGYLKLDSSMARTHLGWRSTVSVETALDWTVEWHRAYLRQEDMRSMTLQHIGRFHEYGWQGLEAIRRLSSVFGFSR
jgi:CDP-glucose 4,6-dehydratase